MHHLVTAFVRDPAALWSWLAKWAEGFRSPARHTCRRCPSHIGAVSQSGASSCRLGASHIWWYSAEGQLCLHATVPGRWHGGFVDEVVRQVAINQMLTMSADELLDRAAALRGAPPLPPRWEDTGAQEALTEQADLTSALAPLRVELDDASWARLGELLRSGISPDAAACRLRPMQP